MHYFFADIRFSDEMKEFKYNNTDFPVFSSNKNIFEIKGVKKNKDLAASTLNGASLDHKLMSTLKSVSKEAVECFARTPVKVHIARIFQSSSIVVRCQYFSPSFAVLCGHLMVCRRLQHHYVLRLLSSSSYNLGCCRFHRHCLCSL